VFARFVGAAFLDLRVARHVPFSPRSCLSRLCLVSPCKGFATELNVAFKIYHTFKLTRLNDVIQLLGRNDVRQVAHVTKQVAVGAFKAVTAGA